MLELVVPDTGPLISLALLNRLDLLDHFNCPIVVTDMVRYELERGGGETEDWPVVQRWLSGSSNRLQTVETTYGLMYRALPPDIQRQIRLRKNAGENSIREFLDSLGETLAPGSQALVLFEDEAVSRVKFGPQVHKVHTYAFLKTMENMGLVPSAQELVRALLAKRRNLARNLYDRPAEQQGDHDDWTASIDAGPRPQGF